MKPLVQIDFGRHLIENDIRIRHADKRKTKPLQIDHPLGRLIAPMDAMKNSAAIVGYTSHEPIIGARKLI